jgi:hypothetical protein
METLYVISAHPAMGMAQAQLPLPGARTQPSGAAMMVSSP